MKKLTALLALCCSAPLWGCQASELVTCRVECTDCGSLAMECSDDTNAETVGDQIGDIFRND